MDGIVGVVAIAVVLVVVVVVVAVVGLKRSAPFRAASRIENVMLCLVNNTLAVRAAARTEK